MSGSRLLLDSNIAIYLSKRSLSLTDFAGPEDTLLVSLVTYMEVVGYRLTNEAEEQFIHTLFQTLHRLSITESIADRVITYRKTRKIRLPDAIILATAREFDCTLVTRNLSDFADIDPAVRIINPFNM